MPTYLQQMPTYHQHAARTECVIDAFVGDLPWPSGCGPALIVRTVDDGLHYALTPEDVEKALSKAAWKRAQMELRILQLRARVGAGFSTVPRLETEPPTVGTGRSALHRELYQLEKFVWLSTRLGQPWHGAVDQLDTAFHSARDAFRRERRQQQAACVECVGRNAADLFAWNSSAHEKATPVSIGKMGECVCGATGCGCETRYMCTHCGALLFPKEAKRAKAVGKYGTKWQGGKFCCSGGQVDLPPIQRDEAVDAVWERNPELLAKHSRRLNNALSIASAPVNILRPPDGGWAPSVVIQGKLHHKVGPLGVGEHETPRFAQLYVYDPAAEGDRIVDQRYAALRMDPETSSAEKARLKAALRDLESALKDCSSYGASCPPVPVLP